MDLHSIMNSDSGAAGASRQASQPAPPHHPAAPPPKAPSAGVVAAPQTPVQAAMPQHPFRDYSQSVHASPNQALVSSPHDYPPSAHSGHIASPTAYHAIPPGTPYASRPAPPPLQAAHLTNDPRSPGSASISNPSPYRHTPTSSLSAASGGYPFPQQPNPNQQPPPPPSPQQRHQYGPPAGYPRDPRDSYGQQGGSVPPAVGMPSPHASVSYPPGQQQVGTPGGGPGHPYGMQHQRSQSLQSASSSTPTSAHPPYGAPFGAQTSSPVATTHAPPHFEHHQRDQRQSSQPPTPLGPPLSSAPRQSSVAPSNYPPSPYQQRLSSASSAATAQPPPPSPYAAHHPPPPTLQQQHIQHSPQPPHPSSLPRAPSMSHGASAPQPPPYDAVSDSHRRSHSQASQARSSDRDRSISVSPRTRVPSLPSSVGGGAPIPRPSSMGGDSDMNHPLSIHPQQAPVANPVTARAQMSREGTPAKRKLEDRDLRPEELEGNNRRPPPPQLNGNKQAHQTQLQQQNSTAPPAMPPANPSPLMPRRKKIRYANPPAWALSGKGVQPNASRNYTLKSKTHHGSGSSAGLVNGNHQPADGSVKSEHLSRHASPEATRASVAVAPKVEEAAATNSQPAQNHTIDPGSEAWVLLEGRPFPIEPISLSKPLDFVAKEVADNLYLKVVDSPNLQEILSRNIQFEVEAKLGTIIDRDTNDRVYYPIMGECIMNEGARVAFRSTMTEVQHRNFNEWLNSNLMATDPRNRFAKPNEHVPIVYKHRHEVDHFYELASSLHTRVPGVMQNSKQPPRARITTDKKTGQVIAIIVKSRVADINIHLPMSPLDCRISINLEWPWDGTADEIMANQQPNRDRQPNRTKDRLSYTQGNFQVDLTQVTQEGGRGAVEKEHELEVEMRAEALLEQGQRLQQGRENVFANLVEAFVNNIRVLARRCPT
ncbi:CYTH-like domain-containing protein [Xylariales sp. PMI_506]|nr:CYTH-like domain-containing protein [Xylariales sp. PMI_506]